MKLPRQPKLYWELILSFRNRKGQITLREVAEAMSPFGWEVRGLTPEEHLGGPGFCWQCAPHTPKDAIPVFLKRPDGTHVVNPLIADLEINY